MIINVRVKAGSKWEKAEKDDAGNWIIRIAAQPVDGKANKALINFLSSRLRIPKSLIQIVKGRSGKFKRIEITGITIHQWEEKLGEH